MTAAPAIRPLYTLAGEKARILEEIEANGGDVTPELAAALEAGNEQIATKVERIVQVIRNRMALATMKQAEAKRLRDDAAGDIKVAEGLESYLKRQLEVAQVSKVQTSIGTISVVKASRPSIRWGGPMEELPEGFRRIKVELDGDKAYEAFKSASLPLGFEIHLSSYIRGL